MMYLFYSILFNCLTRLIHVKLVDVFSLLSLVEIICATVYRMQGMERFVEQLLFFVLKIRNLRVNLS